MNTALLILDAQNDFFTAENPNLAAFEAAVPIINAAIAHFRAFLKGTLGGVALSVIVALMAVLIW